MDQDFDSPRPAPEYPLLSDEVLSVVSKYAPEKAELFKNVTEPGISKNPDELETWEAEGITARKSGRSSSEDDFRYSLRILYEETFGVNQYPDAPFKGSFGHTVGGLLSHFYDGSKVNNVEVTDFADGELNGNTLKEILKNEPDIKKREAIYDWAERLTFPGQMDYLGTHNWSYKSKIMHNPEEMHQRDDVDTYGVRILKLVNSIPELTEDVMDPELRKMCGVRENVKYTKLQFVRFLWSNTAPKTLKPMDDYSVYREEEEPAAQEAFKTLVNIRTHPEFQFLYKFKSPSGYLNSEDTPSN